MICPKCEKEIPDDSKFCNECGEKIEQKPIDIYENSNDKVHQDEQNDLPDSNKLDITKKGKIVATIIEIVVVALCVIPVIYLFYSSTTNNNTSSTDDTSSDYSLNTTSSDETLDSISSDDSLNDTSSEVTSSEPELVVDSDGKKLWKVYSTQQYIHFSDTYKGTGNFIIDVLDSNQDFYENVVNEIGDFTLEKTVPAPNDGSGYFYIEQKVSDGEIEDGGEWDCTDIE